MVRSDVIGDAHYSEPFTIGITDERGYVHVFDDTTVDIVLKTLDTITDFVLYLEKKEHFLTSKKVAVTGEEDLLALYLKRTNSLGEHDFEISSHVDAVVIANEGSWDAFSNNPQRIAQLQADKISYMWDELSEKFAHHLMQGTQYFGTGGVSEQEIILRFMAREGRTRRRSLAQSLAEVLQKTPANRRAARIITPSRPGDPYYLFLLFPVDQEHGNDEYRAARRLLLSHYRRVLKLKFPQALDIIGIATESGDVASRSEDALYLDAREWNQQQSDEAAKIQQEFGLFHKTKTFAATEHEYPSVKRGKAIAATKYSRNSACICGSGKRFKRCCGKVK